MENDGMVKHLREVPKTDAAQVVHSRFINMGGYPAGEHCGASPGAWEPKPDNPKRLPSVLLCVRRENGKGGTRWRLNAAERVSGTSEKPPMVGLSVTTAKAIFAPIGRTMITAARNGRSDESL